MPINHIHLTALKKYIMVHFNIAQALHPLLYQMQLKA